MKTIFSKTHFFQICGFVDCLGGLSETKEFQKDVEINIITDGFHW
jgi:hypothetical protein